MGQEVGIARGQCGSERWWREAVAATNRLFLFALFCSQQIQLGVGMVAACASSSLASDARYREPLASNACYLNDRHIPTSANSGEP